MPETLIIVSGTVQVLKWKFVSKDWNQRLRQTNEQVLADYSLEMLEMQKKLRKQEVGIKIINQILYQRHRRNGRCHQNKCKA